MGGGVGEETRRWDERKSFGSRRPKTNSTVSFAWEVTEVRSKSQQDGDGEERRLILKNISCANLKDRDDGEGYSGDVSDPFVVVRPQRVDAGWRLAGARLARRHDPTPCRTSVR